MLRSEEELNQKYDVFVCCRPLRSNYLSYEKLEDSFTEMLCDALRRERFKTFMEVPGFDRGDNTSIFILKALQVSKTAIIVISDDFAASPYCLDELVHILECNTTRNQPVFAVYYCTSPSEISKLNAKYMIDHKKRFGLNKVRNWESALDKIQTVPWLAFGSKTIPRPGIENCNRQIDTLLRWVTKNMPRFHVFLSFCDKDTRYSFTGYLRETLDRSGFKTFMKDKGWEDGGQISQSAIENSRISIIVLSKNYAYFTSCLDELVTIMNTKNQIVWPVFYDVEPSNVRHQRNSYKEAMDEHEKQFGNDSQKVKTWRSTLFGIASLKGWHLKYGYEYELIQKMVDTMTKI